MTDERKALCWLFVIVAVVVLALLLHSAGNASEIDVGECYTGEYCYVLWPPWPSEKYCDGGLYTLWSCYLPDDPFNPEFWHYHATCDSPIIPPVVFRIILPLVYSNGS